MEIIKKLKDEIWEYCRLNDITDIDAFILKSTQQGFNIEKYGTTPFKIGGKETEVVEKEVGGYKIIADLLDIFVTVLNNHHLGTPTNYDSLLLNLLPKEFQVTSTSPYQRIMAVCSYVSRMSDGYAIRIHKKIQGSII